MEPGRPDVKINWLSRQYRDRGERQRLKDRGRDIETERRKSKDREERRGREGWRDRSREIEAERRWSKDRAERQGM